MTERPLLDPLPRRIIEPQQRAADPKSSIWVEANAGSGKTRVLTDRVLRLMLAGVAPDQILCLTYTKAAAAEMRERVSDRLAAWALSDDIALARQLRELLDAPRRGKAARRGREPCSPSRSRRRAGSRSRPSTPSARACCTASRSRRACRSISPWSTISSARR